MFCPSCREDVARAVTTQNQHMHALGEAHLFCHYHARARLFGNMIFETETGEAEWLTLHPRLQAGCRLDAWFPPTAGTQGLLQRAGSTVTIRSHC